MPDPIDYRCAWCEAPIARAAPACAGCGGIALRGCSRVIQRGRRYIMGELDGQYVAVWDTLTSPDLFKWVRADEADRLRYAFTDWEAAEARKARPRPSRRVAWVIAAVVASVAYVGIHEHRYEGCLVQPRLLAWPSVCF